MPRVLHVLKYYRPAFTGEGVFLERCSSVMQEIAPTVGHDLLVTHTPRPHDPADTAACSTLGRVVHLSGGPMGALRREFRLVLWFLRNLRRYDTVHFRTHADWYFLSYLLARLGGRRLVLSATLDDSLPVLTRQYRPSLRPLVARGFRLFDAYVSISPKLQGETLSTGADPARCHLVPCGVTAPPQPPGARDRVRAEIGAAPEDPVLLFVGGLCRRKDPGFLLMTFPAVLATAPGARLVLLGPPIEADTAAELHGLVHDLGLEGRVTFAGERGDPHPWFAAADILVFASRLEGFGTVVPEAMAHGLPVVVRRLPGVNDFVRHGVTGALFDTAREYVAAVARLAGDPLLRRRWGAAGRAVVRARFAMPRVARRYLGIYGVRDGATAPPVVARAGGAVGGAAGEPAGEPSGERETGLGCTASVLDRRFHAPVEPGPDRTPRLVTMVDAEEAFDWSRPFSRDARDVSSMRRQALAHRVFERHGVVPLYLADHPVATEDAGRAPLRELLDSGACEVGAQMHPWVTPPFDEIVSEANSYAGNLPPALELEKARRLTDALAEAFGERPLIYRTGRFGAGPRTADILKRLGYAADSSVAPCWQPRTEGYGGEGYGGEGHGGKGHGGGHLGGPRGGRWGNWGLSARPYWCDAERTLMEIPVTGALVGRLARRHGERLAPLAFGTVSERLGVAGLLARARLLERIRLSPEGMTLAEAKRLVRAMLAEGHRHFVLTYHSPSLAPGSTPYVRNAAELDRFLGWLDGFYAFFREEVRGRPASWRDLRAAGAAGGTGGR